MLQMLEASPGKIVVGLPWSWESLEFVFQGSSLVLSTLLFARLRYNGWVIFECPPFIIGLHLAQHQCFPFVATVCRCLLTTTMRIYSPVLKCGNGQSPFDDFPIKNIKASKKNRGFPIATMDSRRLSQVLPAAGSAVLWWASAARRWRRFSVVASKATNAPPRGYWWTWQHLWWPTRHEPLGW